MEMDENTIKKGLVARMQLDQMIDQLDKMDIGMPLTWLYIWDVIKHQYGTYAPDSDETYITNPEYTLDDVWDSLWAHPQFTLEYGLEQLDEEILEWLFENNFIVEVEEDEEDEDEALEGPVGLVNIADEVEGWNEPKPAGPPGSGEVK